MDILFILLKSMIIVVNWIIVAKCLKKLDVAIVSGFSLVNTLLIVLGAYLFFGEPLGWIHLFSFIFNLFENWYFYFWWRICNDSFDSRGSC